MNILCIGINHQTAGVELRERLAFNDESARAALSRVCCGGLQAHLAGQLLILSTCNRVEVYAASPTITFQELEVFLSEVRAVPREAFREHLYRYSGEEAVKHLFRVSAGLDSLVLGEAQILGQVARALEIAQNQDTINPVILRLFQSAIRAGRRARSETSIGHNPASVSSVAVRLASQTVPDLRTARITVLGAGEMAELTVEAFRKRGASMITVVNRTLDRARQLANRWQGEAFTFEMLPEAIANADILVSSTGAPHTLVHKEMMERIIELRGGKPLVIIDIAVPRDIDPSVGDLPEIILFDIDSLQNRLAESLSSRAREIPRVEAIIAEEIGSFLQYLRSLDVLPLIAEIRRSAENLRRSELEKTLRRMPDLSPEEVDRIDALTNALVKKILHNPLLRLKTESSGPSAANYAAYARELFDLGDGLHD